jgi:hypothetical protein
MDMRVDKFFNTAGPVNQEEHYKIDPLHRWDLEEILMLIKQKKYFILHAPRQTGKTSSMLELQKYLNNSGQYNAIYINVEIGQAARNNIDSGLGAIVQELSDRINNIDQKKNIDDINNSVNSNKVLNTALKYLCKSSPKPVVLFIDEIDALIGDTLVSVLRQLRSGYDKRPEEFPISIILCGVRDIKDYRIHRSNNDIITGGSAFNIKAESLRLGNFSKEDTKNLLLEHTKESGQIFEDEVFDYIFEQTDGQPWLVNALAYELTYKMKENRDRTVVLTKEMTEEAINRLILSRATHLDQLADKLDEERVRNVVLPMILNKTSIPNKDDEQYCLDLGLIKKTKEGYKISNKIYQEIIPRELTDSRQNNFLVEFRPDWIKGDGSLDTEDLLVKFTQFWRENSEIWASQIKGYEEAAPQLVFQAFLQRVANGNGLVLREYGLGRGRTDLMLKWKTGKVEQRVVIELKIYSKNTKSIEKIEEKALEQTFEYADKLNSTENHIIIFDRDKIKKEWRNKLYRKEVKYKKEKFTIWGI